MRKIRYIGFDKEQWLTEMPQKIRKLHIEYGFYWSKLAHRTIDIKKLVEGKKDSYRHRMCLYRTENDLFFFVVYTKGVIDVFYLKDNYLDTEGKISYFIKKWKKYYDDIDEDEEYEEWRIQSEPSPEKLF